MKTNQFKTRLGVLGATVGSAVGLGNIWRFPYEAGVHGGGAFLLVYIFFVIIIGIPIICAEFMIGRRTGCDVCTAFDRFGRNSRFWRVIGWISILAAVTILGFYCVVAGWTVKYIFQSFSGFGGAATAGELHQRFIEFSSSTFEPLAWTYLFLAINFYVLVRGVEKGIEKMSNLLLPVLFIILIAFTIKSLTLPQAGEGMAFLFKPDFSAITPAVILGALGQAFFSLSIGMGCLITYAGYFKPDTPIIKTASTTALLDTLVAIMAGMIIFPAVFSFGQEPSAGPRLVFEVLPSIFHNMSGGMIWSALFFVLLFVASLTSTISIFEVVVKFLVRSTRLSRTAAVSVILGITVILSTLCSLSFGVLSDVTVFRFTIFNLLDYVSSNICLPLGGMLISIFAGWVIKRALLRDELLCGSHNSGKRLLVKAIIFSLQIISPLGIGLVFIFGL